MDKTVLITGASRGIGREIAYKFAENKYNVVIIYHGNTEEALITKEKCISFGVKAEIYKLDVKNFSEVNKITDDVHNKFGLISVIINNAGITNDKLFLRMSDKDFTDVIDTNINGVFNVTKSFIRDLMKLKSGSIINLSSVVAETGNVGQANYAASKGAIISFTKTLSKEFASKSITVNAIAPGFIKTDMTAKLNDDIVSNIINNIPLKRMGFPQEVADLALFLASDNSRYITGQVINIDGGLV